MKAKQMYLAVLAALTAPLEFVPVRQRFGQSGAVVTVKSTLITARDVPPTKPQNRALQQAPVLHGRAVVSIANGDSAGSKYFLFEIPSNAIPISVRTSAPDIGTTTTFDLGLWQIPINGGAVVDQDFFRAAIVVNAGATSKVEQVNGNVITVANSEKRIWEHLGLASDPVRNFDVIATLVGAADGAGAVEVEIDYVVG